MFLIVGSDFGEVSFGEFNRAENDNESEVDTQAQLSLPHNVQRRLVANVRKCHMERLARQFELSSEVIMGMSEKDEGGVAKNGEFIFYIDVKLEH